MKRGEYRGAGLWAEGIYMGMVLLGVAAQLGVIALSFSLWSDLNLWAMGIGLVLLVAFVFLAIRLYRAHHRRRGAQIATILLPYGLTAWETIDAEAKARIEPYIGGLVQVFDLRYGVNGVMWFASGQEGIAFEHEYTSGSGKHSERRAHTVVAWATDGLVEGDGHLYLVCSRWGEGRYLRKRAGEGHSTGSEAFDTKWLVYGSEDLARKVLTADVRDILLRAPTGEKWSFGYGWVAVSCPFSLDAENAEILARRARDVFLSVKG